MALTPAQRELRRAHRSRLHAIRVLADIEEEAIQEGLPVLDWHVTGHALTGRFSVADDVESARVAVSAWRDHLDGQWQPPYEPIRGQTWRIHISATRASLGGPVQIRIHADVDSPEES